MTIVKIEYNSLVNPSYKFWIEDKAFIPKQEKWINAMCQPLEYICEKKGNWHGLLEELLRICNDTEIQVILCGEKQSYDFLEQFVRNNNFPEQIKLSYMSNENCLPIQDTPLHHQNEINIYAFSTLSKNQTALINALLHTELLPCQYQSDASTLLRIQNCDLHNNFEATCYNESNVVVQTKSPVFLTDLQDFSADSTIRTIDIKGSFPCFAANKANISLWNIPCQNSNTAKKYLSDPSPNVRDKKIIIYIMDAAQMVVCDDADLLSNIVSTLRQRDAAQRSHIIFVVNNCDLFDEEHGESVQSCVNQLKNYLLQFGLDDPIIIPISTSNALLFWKIIKGVELKRKERFEFLNQLESYETFCDSHYENVAMVPPVVRERVNQQLLNCKDSEHSKELEALIHTGLPTLEAILSEYAKYNTCGETEPYKEVENTPEDINTDKKKCIPENEQNIPSLKQNGLDKTTTIKGCENKMTQFFIQYNPYRNECEFQKNGKPMPEGSKFKAMQKRRFQLLLSKAKNWKGLLEEVENACNDTDIELTFRGRRIDFEDLRCAVNAYSGSAQFQLCFEEAAVDSNTMYQLDSIFDEIKQVDIPELYRKNRNGHDVFEAYQYAKDGIFEINVIATMSSGKSTLINAMLHKELLPSENQACTAKITRIQDSDQQDSFEATCYDAAGKVVHSKQPIDLAKMKEYNSDPNIYTIDIDGDIPNVSSKKIRLRLCDTPGPNNSQTEDHRAITTSVIRRKNSVVLYVMNATQMRITDDHDLLEEIANEMNREGKLSHDRFIFVINKCDVLDEEKGETVSDYVENARQYLEQFGMTDPIIIPTSALNALLIRKQQNGDPLTRAERNSLSNAVNDFVEVSALHFEDAAVLTLPVKEKLKQRIETFHANEDNWDKEALIHTGVPAVEETISEYIEKYAFPMKINDSVSDMLAIIDELAMQDAFYKSLDENEEMLKQVQEQIAAAEAKLINNRGIYEEFCKKIEEYTVDQSQIMKWEENLGKETQIITRQYDKMKLIDKMEAEKILHEVISSLKALQANLIKTLEGQLDRELFSKGQSMLEEYQEKVQAILSDAQITGFDFQKVTAVSRFDIDNMDDLMRTYQQDRFRVETRWKDNPEREGFLGRLKFWKPKKISYEVNVKDGEDVRLAKLLGDVVTDFNSEVQNNFYDLFQQAKEQVARYKSSFEQNFDNLEKIIQELLAQIKQDMNTKASIEKKRSYIQEKLDKLNYVTVKLSHILIFSRR